MSPVSDHGSDSGASRSPSPVKYVNHDLSVNLDSTDAFEGPEKLLEMWFAADSKSLPSFMPSKGLRAIPRPVWEQVLDHVQCKVLSVVSTSRMDAYVLSESSLFVFANKLILKTCGTTTLLVGLEPILDAVSQYTHWPRDRQPDKVFYSRKSFMFPDRQKHPHKSWTDEVACLDGQFANGSAYVVGNVKLDHWYLFTAFGPGKTEATYGSNEEPSLDAEDETLEVLMTHLSPVHASQFCTNRIAGETADQSLESSVSTLGAPPDDDDPGHEYGNVVTKLSGIDQIYPTMKQTVDSFCFAPCGYSCNGVVEQDKYFTIHVTPEQHCSYASFETNVSAAKYGMTNSIVVDKVVDIFRPGRFSVTYFESAKANGRDGLPRSLSGYRRSERIVYEIDDYRLVFMTFDALRLKA